MSARAYRVGDVVCVRPDAVEALQREGYRDLKPHVPAKIVDTWTNLGRRVVLLDMVLAMVDFGPIRVAAWASEVRLAHGTAERACVSTEKRVAQMVAAKQAREAARRIPKRRRTK